MAIGSFFKKDEHGFENLICVVLNEYRPTGNSGIAIICTSQQWSEHAGQTWNTKTNKVFCLNKKSENQQKFVIGFIIGIPEKYFEKYSNLIVKGRYSSSVSFGEDNI